LLDHHSAAIVAMVIDCIDCFQMVYGLQSMAACTWCSVTRDAGTAPTRVADECAWVQSGPTGRRMPEAYGYEHLGPG
jgi:hypothetical protein